jgi:hypothetical protein
MRLINPRFRAGQVEWTPISNYWSINYLRNTIQGLS